ncbi:MAG: nucleotidyltransferase family protein [Pseudobdellovibrio sp.]
MIKIIKDLSILQDNAILNAMKIIENYPQKIALVVNPDGVLLGTVTDGDIRRGLIKNISVNDPIHLIMNKMPTYFEKGTSIEVIEKAMISKKISQIPITDLNKVVVDIILSSDVQNQKIKLNSVVLMAGGLGTRLGELTADCPKPMLKIGNKPILEVVISNLKEHGFKDFYLAVNYKAEVIENYFKDGSEFGVNIHYLREKDRLGTAGALSLFQAKNEEPILVMNGDVITKVDFSEFLSNHIKNKYVASMCVRKYDFQVPFGVVNVDEYRIKSVVEKPLQSFFISAGIYILNKEVLKQIPENVYFDMPSLFNKLTTVENMASGVFPIHEYWMDVGQRDDFDQAQLDFKKVF